MLLGGGLLSFSDGRTDHIRNWVGKRSTVGHNKASLFKFSFRFELQQVTNRLIQFSTLANIKVFGQLFNERLDLKLHVISDVYHDYLPTDFLNALTLAFTGWP